MWYLWSYGETALTPKTSPTSGHLAGCLVLMIIKNTELTFVKSWLQSQGFWCKDKGSINHKTYIALHVTLLKVADLRNLMDKLCAWLGWAFNKIVRSMDGPWIRGLNYREIIWRLRHFLQNISSIIKHINYHTLYHPNSFTWIRYFSIPILPWILLRSATPTMKIWTPLHICLNYLACQHVDNYLACQHLSCMSTDIW